MSDPRFTYKFPEEILDSDEARLDRQSLVDAWQACSAMSLPPADPEKARVRAAILEATRTSSQQHRPVFNTVSARIFFLPRFQVAAAVVTVLIAVSFLMAPRSTRITAPTGTTMTHVVSLPDGSIARLSPGSTLIHGESFGNDVRSVTLVGEAFFEVQKGNVPFTVRTFNTETEVLGTRFSVEARPGELNATTNVFVAEGKVSVRSGTQEVLLTPNQKSISPRESNELQVKTGVESASELAWLQGEFWYSNEPLGNVLQDLERTYGVSLKAPRSIRLRPISLHKSTPANIEELLGDISETIKVQYRSTANGFEMYLP